MEGSETILTIGRSSSPEEVRTDTTRTTRARGQRIGGMFSLLLTYSDFRTPHNWTPHYWIELYKMIHVFYNLSCNRQCDSLTLLNLHDESKTF